MLKRGWWQAWLNEHHPELSAKLARELPERFTVSWAYFLIYLLSAFIQAHHDAFVAQKLFRLVFKVGCL
jgi:hypothetical protein